MGGSGGRSLLGRGIFLSGGNDQIFSWWGGNLPYPPVWKTLKSDLLYLHQIHNSKELEPTFSEIIQNKGIIIVGCTYKHVYTHGRPTWITAISTTLIENIFTNNSSSPYTFGNLAIKLSDHQAQFLVMGKTQWIYKYQRRSALLL